eukprot:TRINITY_DN529_c0_g1_i1.p2 TRINITY_DN529_c0_g1~~TRINITY_DN529_c0_g1_i1.p2  ORF type:complete len:101 (+),score=8.79 TRINITY_DN529_c0_g1_i1:119-421(+)
MVEAWSTTSAHASRFALGLQQCQDVTLAAWALDVADQCTAAELALHEDHTNLDDTATRTSAAQHLLNLGKLRGVGIHGDDGCLGQLRELERWTNATNLAN